MNMAVVLSGQCILHCQTHGIKNNYSMSLMKLWKLILLNMRHCVHVLILSVMKWGVQIGCYYCVLQYDGFLYMMQTWTSWFFLMEYHFCLKEWLTQQGNPDTDIWQFLNTQNKHICKTDNVSFQWLKFEFLSKIGILGNFYWHCELEAAWYWRIFLMALMGLLRVSPKIR